MRVVIQRVSRAAVRVDGETVGEIGRGLLALCAFREADSAACVQWMAAKLADLRIFPDDEGKMNRSLRENGGAVLAVSQFTLYGDARKGRRPSFVDSAPAELAEGLYLAFLIPIWLRWRMGDAFVPGSWNNGAKYKWMNLIAVIEIAIISIYFILPFVPAGVPFSQDFDWKFVNYAPILTIGSLIVLAIWWQASAKKWFKGPKVTIDQAVVDAFSD